MSRQRRGSSGTFGITSPGLSERIDTSAPGLGSAISKAITLAVRVQRELRAAEGEGDVTISIRPIGGDVAARVVVRRDIIETFATVSAR